MQVSTCIVFAGKRWRHCILCTMPISAVLRPNIFSKKPGIFSINKNHAPARCRSKTHRAAFTDCCICGFWFAAHLGNILRHNHKPLPLHLRPAHHPRDALRHHDHRLRVSSNSLSVQAASRVPARSVGCLPQLASSASEIGAAPRSFSLTSKALRRNNPETEACPNVFRHLKPPYLRRPPRAPYVL